MRNVMRRGDVQTWGELVTRQAESGLSVQAFCRREGLNAWTFYGWRSRLRARATAEEPPANGSTGVVPTRGFIDLGALPSGATRCEIRLELGGGVVLHLVRG
jgi:putative transposase